MGAITHELFTLVLLYGYPAVAGAEFLSSVGVPLPMTAILLLAGSLSGSGLLGILPLILIVTVAGMAGDLLDFYIGRRVVALTSLEIAGRRLASGHSVQRAQRVLAQHSGAGIFVSRWLLTPLASVVSLLAGFSGYPLRKFLIADVAGDLFGAILFLSLGVLIGAEWPEIWNFLSSLPGLLTTAVIGLALIALGVQRLRQAR